ncbi:alpha/beta fold hydrolase [Marinomonas epiphytica]
MRASIATRRQQFKLNERIQNRLLTEEGLIEHHFLTCKENVLHMVASQNSTVGSAPVLFFHGTPGSWGSFGRYLLAPEFAKNFAIYVADRPGWGESVLTDRGSNYRMSEQSKLLGPLLEFVHQKHNKKILLVGHSYGGSLVPVLAKDYPEYVAGVLVLAGDMDAELSKARWFNQLLDAVPSWLLPEKWFHSNKEVMAIQPDLAMLQTEFANMTTPIHILQGDKDGLVRPDNAARAPSIFRDSFPKVTFLKNASHIIHLTHTQEVINEVTSMVELYTGKATN